MRINTKLLMTLSALLFAVIGLGLTFMPVEIANAFIKSATKETQLVLQVLGSLYFAFAMLNWMAKGSHIGGIYNKPIAMANFTHFFISSLALIKGLLHNPGFPRAIWILACLYSIFAFLFGMILFRSPATTQTISAAQ